MEELTINYGSTKTQKVTSIILGACLVISGIVIGVKQSMVSDYSIIFFSGLVYAICGVILILRNTLWQPIPILRITNNTIETKRMKIDWTSVSKVNIGLGYLVFLLNGEQKQQKLDLSEILFKDVKTVKSKVIELCEQKNIPYHND